MTKTVAKVAIGLTPKPDIPTDLKPLANAVLPEIGLSGEQLRNFSNVLLQLAQHFAGLAEAPAADPHKQIENFLNHDDGPKVS